MTDPFETATPVSLTWKSGNSYSDPWVRFEGRNLDDVATQFQAGVDSGAFATIAKLDRLARAEYQLGAGIGAAPVSSPAAAVSGASTGNDEAQATAGSPVMVPYAVPFNKKDSFKAAAGIANVKFESKTWHLTTSDPEIVAAVKAAGFEPK
jgi:hypothetical protein